MPFLMALVPPREYICLAQSKHSLQAVTYDLELQLLRAEQTEAHHAQCCTARA